MSSRSIRQASVLRRSSLALALALSLGGTGAVLAQSTTGNIFGSGAQPGDSVQISGSTGITREVPVDAAGRYQFNNLPVGSYQVDLKRNGAVVDSRKNVSLTVGKGSDVSFNAATTSASAQSLDSVTVTANSLPPVDVSTVDSRTVITSEQLAKLPLARTAEAIALLAPGAVAGSGYFSGPTGNALVSIGGGSVTENAYYINGFNTTDPISGFGGISLPYGAIDQQEVLAGGYGAAYGRSAGGVISQVGKRGTNEWHFGAQVLWEPRGTRSTPGNDHYMINGPTTTAGEIYNYNKKDTQMRTVESAYVGGPLIKDKLYIFLAAEQEKVNQDRYTSQDSPNYYDRSYRNPKFYGKLDWNINDSNILEVTGASNKQNYDANVYNFDYSDLSRGSLVGKDTSGNPLNKTGADLYTAKYTSYITDDLTLTAQYGKMHGTYYSQVPQTQLPHIITPNQQDPTIANGVSNDNPSTRVYDPQHKSTNTNLRIDLSYHVGDHTITGGIDNQDVRDSNDGLGTSGPGYAWEYGKATDGVTPIAGSPGSDSYVGPAGGQGYFVDQYKYDARASVRVKQRAQYLEDSWQINDRWLLKVGIRNDQFTNYNGVSQPYLRLTSPQWAPRIGATWDVNGDSSLKIYANAGRYYLAMPASVALRSAGQSLFTREYYTYTSIDANGIPSGLTPIATATGGPISSNREYGFPRDPKTAAATNLQSEYQDEFILGFDKTLGDKWVYGAKATVRKLKNAIDDTGGADAIYSALARQGVDPATIGPVQGSYLFNPGRAADFKVPNLNGGYYTAHISNADFGFPQLKRNYYGLEMYLEHPFDGKWYGKVDYLYSKSYGNSEGQVRSDIGQSDVSATVDWDLPELMQYSNGELSNSRRHVLKAYGSYQIADEWMLSGNFTAASGAPKSCLGYFGAGQTDPTGYQSYYHYCYGQPSPPGAAGHNPWTYLVDLTAEYRPMWADKKLAFNVTVFNVLNTRERLATYPQAGRTGAVDPNYRTALYQTTPRYARFGITYDF
ncbi:MULTISPECIES: TonB-dependent receptor [unclassified Luteibacter]|jgi:outer membrane receptor for ferrienterochelin and colicin|uniref:TonB-dependent receptor n=1 Tax=unclassified Luteibacter TaxID=2620188 RepID=UPI00056803BC|nr:MULTISPECIES: TonB-dependent receptor [unclassified Luteibacter]